MISGCLLPITCEVHIFNLFRQSSKTQRTTSEKSFFLLHVLTLLTVLWGSILPQLFSSCKPCPTQRKTFSLLVLGEARPCITCYTSWRKDVLSHSPVPDLHKSILLWNTTQALTVLNIDLTIELVPCTERPSDTIVPVYIYTDNHTESWEHEAPAGGQGEGWDKGCVLQRGAFLCFSPLLSAHRAGLPRHRNYDTRAKRKDPGGISDLSLTKGQSLT